MRPELEEYAKRLLGPLIERIPFTVKDEEHA
jgi:hypothetical protein